jgi:hypothetical protein
MGGGGGVLLLGFSNEWRFFGCATERRKGKSFV